MPCCAANCTYTAVLWCPVLLAGLTPSSTVTTCWCSAMVCWWSKARQKGWLDRQARMALRLACLLAWWRQQRQLQQGTTTRAVASYRQQPLLLLRLQALLQLWRSFFVSILCWWLRTAASSLWSTCCPVCWGSCLLTYWFSTSQAIAAAAAAAHFGGTFVGFHMLHQVHHRPGGQACMWALSCISQWWC